MKHGLIDVRFLGASWSVAGVEALLVEFMSWYPCAEHRQANTKFFGEFGVRRATALESARTRRADQGAWSTTPRPPPSRRGVLEAREEVELEERALARPVERLDPVDLEYREPEQVHAGGRARALDQVAVAAEQRRLAGLVPGHARVEEGADLDRERPVEVALAEQAEQRRAHLEVAHEQAAAEHAIEDGAAPVGRNAALGRSEGPGVVPADEVGIAQVERVEARVLGPGAVPPVMQEAARDRHRPHRHQVAADVGQDAGVVDVADDGAHVQAEALAHHRAGGPEH